MSYLTGTGQTPPKGRVDYKDRILSVKLNGEEIAEFTDSMGVEVTSDDSDGWKDLLPKSYEVEWHIGDGVYKATISRQEFQRMIDDGVLK